MAIRYYSYKNGGEPYRFYSRTHSIVFFLDAGAIVTTPRMKNRVLHENEMLLVESLCRYHIQMMPGCRMFILSFVNLPAFMNTAIMKYLTPDVVQASDVEGPPVLKSNMYLSNYVRSLRVFETGRCSKELVDIKSDEFFYLLKDFYDISDVELFLRPCRSKLETEDFTILVMRSYTPFMSVKQLSVSLDKSPTTLVRLFEKHFDITPAGWIRQQNMKRLKEMLKDPSRSLSDIALELNVSSVQQLSRYCKINFGMTPKQLRLQSEWLHQDF